MEHLEQVYIDFETMQREVVIWLDNAEDSLREFDQLKDDAELSDNDINKFKVKRVFSLFRCIILYIPLTLMKISSVLSSMKIIKANMTTMLFTSSHYDLIYIIIRRTQSTIFSLFTCVLLIIYCFIFGVHLSACAR